MNRIATQVQSETCDTRGCKLSYKVNVQFNYNKKVATHIITINTVPKILWF